MIPANVKIGHVFGKSRISTIDRSTMFFRWYIDEVRPTQPSPLADFYDMPIKNGVRLLEVGPPDSDNDSLQSNILTI